MRLTRTCAWPKFITKPAVPLRRLYSTATATPCTSSQRNPKSRSGTGSSTSSTTTRHYTSNSQERPLPKTDKYTNKSSGKTQPKAKKKKFENAIVPQNAKKFMGLDGKLLTTPDNWAFFQETGIEPNNARIGRLLLPTDNNRITANFSLRVGYSPLHILSPYHLAYFSPNGHPLVETIKAKYRLQVQQQPVWVHTVVRSDQPAIVRGVISRRLKAAFYSAMKELGYPESGVKGTVMITIYDPSRAARNPAHIFGDALAKAVDKAWKDAKRKKPEAKKVKKPVW